MSVHSTDVDKSFLELNYKGMLVFFFSEVGKIGSKRWELLLEISNGTLHQMLAKRPIVRTIKR